MEGALLLSQLFKNALFLSLMRITDRCNMDDTTSDLFDAIAVASIREAQWLTLELIATHDQSEMPKLRKQFLETMEYCYHGGATQVHQADDQSKGLAGFFIERFATARGDDRRKAMLDLYNDREYLTRVIVTFIAVFSAFLNDPDFSIEGIDRDGVHAVDVDPTLRDNES
ncbi:hypothetical protein BMS3Bbin04_01191 [bacterium BMS3Bbin04]|nr:hypothetical protein BMS3Bbin04_01191 [bacterium BMS3Bbin04]